MPKKKPHAVNRVAAVFACLTFGLANGLSLLSPSGSASAQHSPLPSADTTIPQMQGFNQSVLGSESYERELLDMRDRIRVLLSAVDDRIAGLETPAEPGSEATTNAAETFTPVFSDAAEIPATPAAVVVTSAAIPAVANWSVIGFGSMLWRNVTQGGAWKLLLVALAGCLALAWLLRPSHRPRQYQQGDETSDFTALALEKDSGVTIARDDSAASIDVDDEPWYSQTVMDDQEMTEQEDVDLITQSDVYLAYGRTMQAVQVLQEEYDKPDSDRFVVANKLIQAYRKMGEDDERNDSMRTFINRLNQDIDIFSTKQWDSLRQELDRLRRDEQLQATGSPAVRSAGTNRRVAANPLMVAYDARKAVNS